MNRKIGFLIILALIILYVALGYIAIPFKGIISLLIFLGIAVVSVKCLKKKDK